MTPARRYFVALVIILALPAPTAAQRPVDLSTLDAAFTQALKDWAVPGMAIAIVKDGKVVLAKGYGVNPYVTNDTRVRDLTEFRKR